MPPRPPSSRPSASAHSHGRVVRGDSEISSLDLNLSSEASQAVPSHSRALSSRPRTRRGYEGNSRPRSRPSSGLHIDLPPHPQPLRAEDLQSEAVTSGSTTYQNGHSHLLAIRDRRHNEMIQTAVAIAILDPLRNTTSAEIRQAVYGSPETYGDGATSQHQHQHQQPRSEPSSYRGNGSEQPRSQRSSSEQSSTRSRPLLAGDIYGVGYGYGFEGHTGARNNSESTTSSFSSHRAEPSTTFFEDTLFELRSSSPIYIRESSTLATRPDIHNSMAPFQGVDPDFAQYQAAELGRHVEQTPGQTESSPSLSELSSVISFDSRDYET
ncbi:hypothetical protein N7481_003315 [Penicillium waksmanii]|uniref:uncharacterized protein n=1 Tax=Penicillium waksmanii TaxID=69791 RepID=UPI002546EC87|nr:uncharacterized protein N7481_003315 [Penicillium waksmanii]KAJ5988105.1 hypothetical protein N7481_003315 [Penicillium waksmanii]